MESSLNKSKKFDVKKLVVLGMLAAMAYALTMLTHSITMAPPPFSFLTYDAKDIIVIIAGFIFGPLSAALMSAVVSLLEMLTVSSTDWIGLIMNILSTCSIAVTASAIYKQRRTVSGAIIGLVSGVIVVTAVMLLWNYLITPIYMRDMLGNGDITAARETISGYLVPIFLPFNLIKAAINATLVMLIYKPLKKALKASRLLPSSNEGTTVNKKVTVWLYAGSFLLLAAAVVLALVFTGVI